MTHESQEVGLDLQEGDEVLFNDRSRTLTVVGSHKRKNASNGYQNEADQHKVVELEGNQTTYHLICTDGCDVGPMLYKESDWDDDKTNKFGQSPRYSRFGERVWEIEVVEE